MKVRLPEKMDKAQGRREHVACRAAVVHKPETAGTSPEGMWLVVRKSADSVTEGRRNVETARLTKLLGRYAHNPTFRLGGGIGL